LFGGRSLVASAVKKYKLFSKGDKVVVLIYKVIHRATESIHHIGIHEETLECWCIIAQIWYIPARC
jgi:hypothetical protein